MRLSRMNGLAAYRLTQDNTIVIPLFSLALSSISKRNLLDEPFYL